MPAQRIEKIEFNPAQQAVMDHALLDTGFSCILQLPTGSGKTWLAKEAIRKSLRAGNRVVYLSPLRALADELSLKWHLEFEEFPVGVFTGDYGKNGRKFPVTYEDSRVLIMTPERLDSCTRNWRTHWNWIPEVDWLIVDEIHLLGDGNRGARLEGTISRFRRLNPFCRVLGLSATLGNRDELAAWLDGVAYSHEWRSIPLQWRTVHFKKADEKPALLATELRRVLNAGGQSLVFVQSRRRAEHLATYLRSLGINASHHPAGLDHTQRRTVEDSFRTHQTSVLVATGTLEMGLNLPARQVVLYDLQAFDGSTFSPLSVNTVWQRAGRAGRPGLDSLGEAVLLAPTWEKSAAAYPQGKFEDIRSGLNSEAALAEQILIEVQSGMARSEVQLRRVFSESLAAQQRISLPFDSCLHHMLDSGMIQKKASDKPDREDRFFATRLGKIATRHQLRPAAVLALRSFLEQHQKFTSFDLLVACASSGDCEPLLAVDFEELEHLADALGGENSFLFGHGIPASNPIPVTGKRLLAALKTATVMMRWTRLGDLETVAEEDGCYPFEILRLQESLDRLLLAAGAIQDLIDTPLLDTTTPTEERQKRVTPNQQRIALLRQMILTGLDESTAALTFISGVGQKWAGSLHQAGFRDLSSLAAATVQELAALPGLSSTRATQWIESAANLIHQPTLPPLNAPRIRTLPVDSDLPLDPYRLRRALDLQTRKVSSTQWTVSGGLEPHAVSVLQDQLSCDCLDHQKGHTCKHILAVRITSKDPVVTRALSMVNTISPKGWLDLFSLWFAR